MEFLASGVYKGSRADFYFFDESRLLNATSSTKPWYVDTLAALTERRDLTDEQIRLVMQEFMGGRCEEVEMASILIGLRVKGETAAEIAAAAQVMREHMVRVDTRRDDVLDTSGTGGDGAGTFNISTAAAIVAAGAGVPVVKHGNRAVSSNSGSADVLAALGVAVEGDPAKVRRCLDEAGLAFCFGPNFHPAMRHVAGVRRRLGVRTIFNCLGPLANPAGAAYQLLGVGRPPLLDLLAGALATLGTRKALLVCGRDGLDEVSLWGPTLVREVRHDSVTSLEWTPADFGLEPCRLSELIVEGPDQSAAVIRGILQGQEGPATRMTLANAAAALLAAERVGSLPEGVALSRQAIHTGKAWSKLRALIALSN